MTAQFPEVAAEAPRLAWDGILDGEVLAFGDGTWFCRSSRCRRGWAARHPPRRSSTTCRSSYVAFDVLALGPRGGAVEPLLDMPLSERRARLEALDLPGAEPGRFALSHLVPVDSIDELEEVFAAARARRNEGLMVKDPTSPYSPGRRGLGWLKMKKALATLDCVVVGVEVGHGKRHGVLSDYTFAVRDEASGTLVTIGKAYTGLTDAELAEMTAWFEEHTISRHGRYRLVEPTVVVEIAFDVILRSPATGPALRSRFPRIARLRPTSGGRRDTLATVETLWRGLQHGRRAPRHGRRAARGTARSLRPRPARAAAPGAATPRMPTSVAGFRRTSVGITPGIAGRGSARAVSGADRDA